jgi:hypothetical protein
MSWDEAFAGRYDEWSAHMTEDVAFYVVAYPEQRIAWVATRGSSLASSCRERSESADECVLAR